MKRDQVRITIAITKELYDKIATVSESYGMSKSGLVAYYVGRAVDTEIAIKKQTPNMMDTLLKLMLERGDIPDYVDSQGVRQFRPDDQPDEKAEGF